MMALAAVQMVMDNPKLDLMYFLCGVLLAALPTSVLGMIGYFVVRDWYRNHYVRRPAPTPPGPAGR
jgi:ABC-type phosphate transport system permease subunit